MKNIQEKFEGYQKQIITRQKYFLLIESIKVLGKYRGIESILQLQKEHGYQFDIANNLFLTLFDELQKDLIIKDFIIDLDYITIDGFCESLNEFYKIDPLLSNKIDNLYGKMRESFYYLQHWIGENQDYRVDLISLLLENGQNEKIVELVVSGNVPNFTKKNILHNIISNYPDKLEEIFDTIPSLYVSRHYEIDDKEKFKRVLNQSLREVLDDSIKNEIIIRKAINDDNIGRGNVRCIVQFFIEHNLIDINKVTWTYQESIVSSAAAAYITGDDCLGRYLYSLPAYQQTDSMVRTNSDKAILENLLKRKFYFDLTQFIQNKNYESTPEKLGYIMQVILELQPKNPDIIDDIHLDRIIDILLRKTKKKDYKDMKRAIADIKTNTDINLLNEKRQEFTRKFRMLNDLLLSTVTATTVIKDLEFNPDTGICKVK